MSARAQDYLEANRQQIQDIINQVANATNSTQQVNGTEATQTLDELLTTLDQQLARLGQLSTPDGGGRGRRRRLQQDGDGDDDNGGIAGGINGVLSPDVIAGLRQQLGLSSATSGNLTWLWNRTVESGVLDGSVALQNSSLWRNVTTNGTAANTALKQLADAYTRQPLGGRGLYSTLAGCSNARPCPSGNFCPTPALLVFCQPGTFCALGSVGPTTCNITRILNSVSEVVPCEAGGMHAAPAVVACARAHLLASLSVCRAQNPALALQKDPQLLLQELNQQAAPIEGNVCPASAPDPYAGCPAGSFCPDTATTLVCPAGHWW